MGSGLIRHLALSLLGATISRLLIFLMLPIAARLYSKDDFGGLALVVGFVGLIHPLLTLRYEIAIVLPRSDSVARAITQSLLVIATIGYGLVSLIVAIAPDLLAPVADPQLISELRVPVLMHLAATVLTVTFAAWLQRKGKFQIVALSQMLGSLVTAIVVLGAPLLLAPNLVVLFSGYVLGAATSAAVVLYGAVATRLFNQGPARSLRRLSSVIRKYRVYPTFSLPLSLSALVADRTLLVYLSTTFSLATLGGFFSIRQLLMGLVHLVTATLSQVIYAYVARSDQKVASLSTPLLTLTSGIAVSAGLSLGWVGSNSLELTRVLLGPAWLETARIVPWIAAQSAIVAVVGWHGRLLDVERRQRLDAGLQMAGDAATLTAIALLWLTAAGEIPAIATICMVGAFHGIAWLTIFYRVIGIGAGHALTIFAKLALAAAASATCSMATSAILNPPVGSVVSLVLTMAAVLTTIAFAIRQLDRQLRDTGLRAIP